MSKTRASCFIRGSKHLETIKALSLRPRAFICFSVFATPDETLALVFDILHPIHRPSIPLRHWKTGGTLNASKSKEISLFSTQISALPSAGSLFAREIFHSPSEEKEDYSACMLRKAEQTLLRL